jgi:LmbE family N-acetylglucosaminyl deacetylase
VRPDDRGPLRALLAASARGLVFVVALAGPAAVLAARPDPHLEPFDPRSDYGYDLTTTEAEIHPVAVTDARRRAVPASLSWPPGVAGDTAFLELDLLGSRRDAPTLRVRGGNGAEVVQVFEDGARGRRFVDVSPLLRGGIEAGETIELAVDGVRLASDSTRLYAFANPPVSSGLRVLVVAPHPDDAEIAAFGVYSSTDADVVTVTSGDAGAPGFAALFPEPGEHYRVKGWIRTWDSIVVPFFGGVAPGRARNLGYYDATLRRLWQERPRAIAPALAKLESPGFYRSLNIDPRLRERPFTASWPSLVGDLRAELDLLQPRVVVAPHPLLDRHADHQFTTVALLEALEAWPGDCELWLYTNHATGNESWPFGPPEAMSGLPPWPAPAMGGAADTTAAGLFFSRLYSHPLDADARRRKQVALEAMHDLRPFDLREDEGDGDATSRRERAEARRYDYFRRAPRPNELFFVLTRDDARRLRAFVLEHAAAEPQPPRQDRPGSNW